MVACQRFLSFFWERKKEGRLPPFTSLSFDPCENAVGITVTDPTAKKNTDGVRPYRKKRYSHTVHSNEKRSKGFPVNGQTNPITLRTGRAIELFNYWLNEVNRIRPKMNILPQPSSSIIVNYHT
jgi:hypothetical protein